MSTPDFSSRPPAVATPDPQPKQSPLLALRDRMAARPFALAIPMILMAVVLMNVTLVDGHYAFVLIAALLFTVVADVLLIYAAWRGGIVVRIIALFCLLIPTQFIVSDFIRRAPYVFGW